MKSSDYKSVKHSFWKNLIKGILVRYLKPLISVMTDTPAKIDKTGEKTLVCPDCGKYWAKCQCSTHDLSVSLPGKRSKNEKSDRHGLEGTIVSNKYEIIEILGEGGMGGVYLAEHLSLRKKVALKILRKNLITDEVAVSRLLKEAQACAMLYHSNLVSVFDFGFTENGFPFIVMEYLEGENLENIEDIPIKRLISILVDICSGLELAHANGIIHRDLKPSNVLVVEAGTENERAVVADFGIARFNHPGGEKQYLTQTGELVGSPAYMSPEQIEGISIDERSDIYSIGCIIYEMVTGEQLYRGHSLMAILEANLKQEFSDTKNIDLEGVDDNILVIMQKCLEKDPDDRYQSISELKEDLLNFSTGSGEKSSIAKFPIFILSVLCLVLTCLLAFTYFSKKPENKIVSKKNIYKDLFKARKYEILEYYNLAGDKYRACMTEKGSVNSKLAAYGFYLRWRGFSINQLHKRYCDRFTEDLERVRTEAEILVNDSNANSIKYDKNLAAFMYGMYAKSNFRMAVLLAQNKYLKKSEKPDNSVMKQMCATKKDVKTYMDKSASGLEKAIKIEDIDKLDLANYCGYMGIVQGYLGEESKSYEYYDKAIEIFDNTKEKSERYHSIWWHCEKGKTLLSYGKRDQAINQLAKCQALLKKYQSPEGKGAIKMFTTLLKTGKSK